jgi:hypothetical protein
LSKSTVRSSSMSKIVSRSIFVNTETTPNPQSMKFLPGQEILPESFGTGMYFQRGELAEVWVRVKISYGWLVALRAGMG